MTKFPQVKQPIIIIGSNSVHTLRYFYAITQLVNTTVVLITNSLSGIDISINKLVFQVDFSLKNLRARYQIASVIKKYHDPIIHIHQANSYTFHTIHALKFLKSNAKIILTAWGSDILLLPHRNLFLKKMVRYNLKNVNIITSDSLYMSNEIRVLANNVDVRTINFGIKYFPDKCKISTKQDIILSTRLHKSLYKIDQIIISYANLIKNYPEYSTYKLIIAATGDNTFNLKGLAKSLGLTDKQIEFVGMLDDQQLQYYYSIAKLFISIPSSDATSLSLLEALANGCVPIVSNLPANLEWIINDINGVIVENTQVLVSDIIKAIQITQNTSDYRRVIDFNHYLIGQKGVFSTNIYKFINLYS